MLQPNPSTLGDVKLSYRFILLGLISLILFSILYFFVSGTLSYGAYRVNDVWTLVHLFTLGFIVMIVMGVMYQLIPVALLVPIFSDKLSRVQFWVYTIGVIGLSLSLYLMNYFYMYIFGTITFSGVILFTINISLSAVRIKKWNMMSVIIVTAVIYLFLTVLFGLLLVLDFQYELWVNYHDSIFYSHLLFGLVGWLTSVIIGFSYKMIPMFALSHGYREHLAKYIYVSLQLGILTSVVGLFSTFTKLIFLGLFLILTAFVLFAIQVRHIIKKKMKSKLDIGFTVAINTATVTGVGIVIMPIAFYLWGDLVILPFGYLFLTGWIGLSVMGYLFKIVPFLWWTDKYSERVGKENVPMLKDMVDENKGKIAFILLSIGIFGNALGLGLQESLLMNVSNVIFVMGAIIYSYNVLKVFSK